MFTRIAILLAVFVVVIAPVRASDAPISGGPGGKPFKFTCNDGYYLVGFAGRHGSWIDQIRPLCAPWLSSQQTLGKPQASSVSFGDSQGGYPFKAHCPNNYIIPSLTMTFSFKVHWTQDVFLGSVSLECTSLKVPYDRQSILIEPRVTNRTGYLSHSRYSDCGPGEVATGIRGRSGLFVDALGLVCGPPPQPINEGARSGPGQGPTSIDRKILQPKSKVGDVLGGTKCIAGYVPRLARPTDSVCVTPESAARVAQENATAASRRDPNGRYGPNSCIKGFVWREAFAGDVVCVTPEVRQLVRQENALASSRSTGPMQLP